MNNALQGVGSQTFEDVRKWVDNFFASQSQEFFREGIHELWNRWQEVLDNNGEHLDDWDYVFFVWTKLKFWKKSCIIFAQFQ